MQCKIAKNYIRPFTRCLECLQKISNECFVEIEKAQLVFAALDSQQTRYCEVKLKLPLFTEYTVVRGVHKHYCILQVKQFLSAFRSIKDIEECQISIERGPWLRVTSTCKYEVKKIYSLRIQEVEHAKRCNFKHFQYYAYLHTDPVLLDECFTNVGANNIDLILDREGLRFNSSDPGRKEVLTEGLVAWKSFHAYSFSYENIRKSIAKNEIQDTLGFIQQSESSPFSSNDGGLDVSEEHCPQTLRTLKRFPDKIFPRIEMKMKTSITAIRHFFALGVNLDNMLDVFIRPGHPLILRSSDTNNTGDIECLFQAATEKVDKGIPTQLSARTDSSNITRVSRFSSQELSSNNTTQQSSQGSQQSNRPEFSQPERPPMKRAFTQPIAPSQSQTQESENQSMEVRDDDSLPRNTQGQTFFPESKSPSVSQGLYDEEEEDDEEDDFVGMRKRKRVERDDLESDGEDEMVEKKKRKKQERGNFQDRRDDDGDVDMLD